MSKENVQKHSVAGAKRHNDGDAIDDADDGVIYIGRNHVDNYAMDSVTALSRNGNVTLRAKGGSIPTAVTVANMITREILKGSSRVRQILLDTDAEPGIGDMTSTIEIRLDRQPPSGGNDV